SVTSWRASRCARFREPDRQTTRGPHRTCGPRVVARGRGCSARLPWPGSDSALQLTRGCIMSSPRVRKLADRIKVIVAEMLERGIKDPRLGFVTVTDVRVSGDTQHATIFYTVLGGADDIDGTGVALESATGLIRSEVGKQLGMRHTPTLEFVLDGVPENARQIEDLLAKARES